MFERWSKVLPAGKLLPCLSQAVSSLAHPHGHTKQQIQKLVAGVTCKHPSRSLWLLRAVIMSKNEGRRESADAVMSQVQKNASEDLKALIKSHGEVCQGIEVCPVLTRQADLPSQSICHPSTYPAYTGTSKSH
jgi:hypothetical protein